MNWYFSVEGHSEGPVTEQKLAELARGGEVGTDTLIWHPGLEEWEPVWKLKPEIVEHLNKKAMAQQAKGTTDRIPIADVAAQAEQGGVSEGIFKRLMGRLRKK
jgi:GYF domain 2